jgi:acyl carrier protein
VSDDVLSRLQRLIAEKILTEKSRGGITVTTPLLSFGLDLDSVAILELLMEIEREFGVEFRDDELSVELFKTVGTLAAAITGKLPAAAAVTSRHA